MCPRYMRPAPLQTQQELTALSWSKNGLYLAIATIKGNLLMYNR